MHTDSQQTIYVCALLLSAACCLAYTHHPSYVFLGSVFALVRCYFLPTLPLLLAFLVIAFYLIDWIRDHALSISAILSLRFIDDGPYGVYSNFRSRYIKWCNVYVGTVKTSLASFHGSPTDEDYKHNKAASIRTEVRKLFMPLLNSLTQGFDHLDNTELPLVTATNNVRIEFLNITDSQKAILKKIKHSTKSSDANLKELIACGKITTRDYSANVEEFAKNVRFYSPNWWSEQIQNYRIRSNMPKTDITLIISNDCHFYKSLFTSLKLGTYLLHFRNDFPSHLPADTCEALSNRELTVGVENISGFDAVPRTIFNWLGIGSTAAVTLGVRITNGNNYTRQDPPVLSVNNTDHVTINHGKSYAMEISIFWFLFMIYNTVKLELAIYHFNFCYVPYILKDMILTTILLVCYDYLRKPSKQKVAQMIAPIESVASSREAKLVLVCYGFVSDHYTPDWFENYSNTVAELSHNTVGYNSTSPMLFETDLYGLTYVQEHDVYIVTKELKIVEDTKINADGKCRTLDCVAVYLIASPNAPSHRFYHGVPVFINCEQWQTISTSGCRQCTADSFYYDHKIITLVNGEIHENTRLNEEVCHIFNTAFGDERCTTLQVPATAVVKNLKNSSFVVPEALTQFLPTPKWTVLSEYLATQFSDKLTEEIPTATVIQSLAVFYLNFQQANPHFKFFKILNNIKRTSPKFVTFIKEYVASKPTDPIIANWPYKNILDHINRHGGKSRSKLSDDDQFTLPGAFAPTHPSPVTPIVQSIELQDFPPNKEQTVKSKKPFCILDGHSNTATPIAVKPKLEVKIPKDVVTPAKKSFITISPEKTISPLTLEGPFHLFDMTFRNEALSTTNCFSVDESEWKSVNIMKYGTPRNVKGKTPGDKLSRFQSPHRSFLTCIKPKATKLPFHSLRFYNTIKKVYFTCYVTSLNEEALTYIRQSYTIAPSKKEILATPSGPKSPSSTNTVSPATAPPITQEVFEECKKFFPCMQENGSCPLPPKFIPPTTIDERVIPFSLSKDGLMVEFPFESLETLPPFPDACEDSEYVIKGSRVSKEYYDFYATVQSYMLLKGPNGYYSFYWVPAFEKGLDKAQIAQMTILLVKQSYLHIRYNSYYQQLANNPSAIVDIANLPENNEMNALFSGVSTELNPFITKLFAPPPTDSAPSTPREDLTEPPSYAEVVTIPRVDNVNLNNNVQPELQETSDDDLNSSSPHSGDH